MDCYVFSQVDYNVILFVAICTSEVEQNLSGSDLLVKFVHRALLKKTLDFSFSPGNSEKFWNFNVTPLEKYTYADLIG
jgi:hypothetical protein